jgi:hypothetical protein
MALAIHAAAGSSYAQGLLQQSTGEDYQESKKKIVL